MPRVTVNEGVDKVKEGLRKVALASVGAVALVKDGAFDIAKKWVRRGEEVEPEIKRTFGKLGKKREQVTEKTESTLKKAWGYMPLVTKRDITDLAKRIDALAAKVGGKRAK